MEFSIENMKAEVSKAEKGRLACKKRERISPPMMLF